MHATDDTAPPRYSRLPLPPYRHRPGRTPHPVRDPRGHSHGVRRPADDPLRHGRWEESELYRHGIDLFNHRYWWECHEALEHLWRLEGGRGPRAAVLQAVIQLASGLLLRAMARPRGPQRLGRRALAHLADRDGVALGLDLAELRRVITRSLLAGGDPAPKLRLERPLNRVV